MNCLVKELQSIYVCPEFKDENIDNLLALLLGRGKITIKSREMANRLLSIYDNNLKNLSKANVSKVASLIGMANANILLSALEFARRVSLYQEKVTVINSPEDAANLLMNEMRYYQKEVFKIILLNTKNQVVRVETVSIGTIDASIVHPRDVFYPAIKEMASSILLLHNHPSGVPIPSQQDIEITKNIIAAGKTIQIDVIDHIIIGDGKYISMKEKKYI